MHSDVTSYRDHQFNIQFIVTALLCRHSVMNSPTIFEKKATVEKRRKRKHIVRKCVITWKIPTPKWQKSPVEPAIARPHLSSR